MFYLSPFCTWLVSLYLADVFVPRAKRVLVIVVVS